MHSIRDEPNTVFVDNLQDSTTLGTLWKTFNSFGRITNVHRPAQKRLVTNTRYAFVSFESNQQAAVAIQETNGLWIDGGRIATQFARPLRSRFQKQCWVQSAVRKTPSMVKEDEVWSNFSECQKAVGTDHHVADETGGPVKLFPSELLIPRLERSILVRTRKRTTLVDLEERLKVTEDVEHIICKSPVEFLVIFRHERQKASFLDRKEWVLEEWTVDACCEDQPQQYRIASIAVRGIPAQAWCEASAKAIAERFGSVIEIETNFAIPPMNLEIFLTIKTKNFKIINDEVEVIFDGKIAVVGIVEFWADDLSRSYGASVVEGGVGNKGVLSSSPADPVIVGSEGSHELDNIDCNELVERDVLLNQMGNEILSPEAGGLLQDAGTVIKANISCSVGLGAHSLAVQSGNQMWQLVLQLRKELPVNWSLLIFYFLEWYKSMFGGQRKNRPVSYPVAEQEATEDQMAVSLMNSRSRATKESESSNLSFACSNECIQVQTFSIGQSSSPKNDRPSPVDSNLPKEIELEVVISPEEMKPQSRAVNLQGDLFSETKSKQSRKCPKPQRKKRKKTRTKISAEARECFKYGQRLRIHSPYPLRSLANIDRILRSSGNRN